MKSPTNAPKRWWYIMPVVFITYSLAYLDRANFSFASAAGINDDLGITKGISSLLGALFFLGYFFFQIPGAIYGPVWPVLRDYPGDAAQECGGRRDGAACVNSFSSA
ncbi:2-ketogluconate transporter [Cronobacter malonaticus 507]|nr:2-ketogluconate transporter [Cronobacter malonaticus 507]